MTASTGNARRAMTLLKQSLDALGHSRLSAVADVVGKCLDSLAAQVEFYEGLKSPLRSMVVRRPDGSAERISAMELARLDVPGTVLESIRTAGPPEHAQLRPLSVYGSPEAIEALTALLADRQAEGDAPCTISPPSQQTLRNSAGS